MVTFKIGDILTRNTIKNEQYWETFDPKEIKIIDYSSIDKATDAINFNLNLCNGYIIQDMLTGEKCCATPEYVNYYYYNQRKEKLKKIGRNDNL